MVFAVTFVRQRSGVFAASGLVSRVSGALASVGCPPMKKEAPRGLQ